MGESGKAHKNLDFSLVFLESLEPHYYNKETDGPRRKVMTQILMLSWLLCGWDQSSYFLSSVFCFAHRHCPALPLTWIDRVELIFPVLLTSNVLPCIKRLWEDRHEPSHLRVPNMSWTDSPSIIWRHNGQRCYNHAGWHTDLLFLSAVPSLNWKGARRKNTVTFKHWFLLFFKKSVLP